jgi:hypothetical protein
LSRTQAASVGVIGVAERMVTGSFGAGSTTSSTSLGPNNTAVNGAPSQRGVSRSTRASGTSTRPSTAGDAATIAIERASPIGVEPRSVTTTSARGPLAESTTIDIGSSIACREQPSDTW